MVDTNAKTGRPFELHAFQPRENSAVVQFTWCLAQTTRDKLQEKGVAFPHMFLGILKRDEVGHLQEYDRQIVPLDSAAQVYFYDPGTFEIHASIIWATYDGKGKDSCIRTAKHRSTCGAILNVMLRRESSPPRDFKFPLLNRYSYRHNQVDFDNLGVNHLGWSDHCTWIVPEGQFAPEPSKFMKRWVGLFYNNAPNDQCHFRKWKFLTWALTFSGLALAYLLLRWMGQFLLLLFGLLIGRRDLDPRALLHPKKWDFMDVYTQSGREAYWWLTNSEGKCRKGWVSVLFMPVGWELAASVGAAIAPQLNWIEMLMMAGLFLASFLVLVVGIILIARVNNKETQLARTEFEKFYEDRLEPLVCTQGGPKVGSFKALPESHKTYRIRFLDTKAKVCKPFRRGAYWE